MPGNLTAIFECKLPELQHLAIDGKIAFRIPTSNELRETIKRINSPIISTSINVSGEPPEKKKSHIIEKFEDWFDFEILSSISKDVIPESSTIVDFTNNTPILIREGSIKFSKLNNLQILFVCTGNTCRSPLAELYSKTKKSNFIFNSAGIKASCEPINKNSVKVLSEENIDGFEFLSKNVDSELVENSLIVLTMENKHKEFLIKHYPNQHHKFFTFADFVDENADISDPFGEDLATYRSTFKIIKKYCDKLITFDAEAIINRLEK